MTRYSAGPPFKSVEAVDPHEAAAIFGRRLARRRFGQRGVCVSARLDSRRADGRAWHFQLSIGLPARGGGFGVYDEWLTVRPVPQATHG